MKANGRERRHVETAEFGAMVRRMVRAYTRRVSKGDIASVRLLAGLRADVDNAITDAVRSLHAAGYSWTEIAVELGISRQAARQRYAEAPEVARVS